MTKVIMQRFFFITILGFLIMLTTYLLAFGGYIGSSETDLVRYSYLWVPIIIAGISGMLASKKDPDEALKYAILLGIASLFILTGFYEAIWPML